jgi:hypothetical protein
MEQVRRTDRLVAGGTRIRPYQAHLRCATTQLAFASWYRSVLERCELLGRTSNEPGIDRGNRVRLGDGPDTIRALGGDDELRSYAAVRLGTG